MAFFTRPLARQPATVSPANPAPSSDEVAAVQEQYQKAEREFSEACRAVFTYQREHPQADVVMRVGSRAFNRVNGSSFNPELSLLCHVRELARLKRNSLLNQRAQLLKATGKVR
jgi:hypothetical protein